MNIEDSKFDSSIQSILDRLSEILGLMKCNNRLDGETLFDNQDLCFMLKVSKRTLQRYRSQGILPYFQVGKKTYYQESDVKLFIEKHINKQTDKEDQS